MGFCFAVELLLAIVVHGSFLSVLMVLDLGGISRTLSLRMRKIIENTSTPVIAIFSDQGVVHLQAEVLGSKFINIHDRVTSHPINKFPLPHKYVHSTLSYYAPIQMNEKNRMQVAPHWLS